MQGRQVVMRARKGSSLKRGMFSLVLAIVALCLAVPAGAQAIRTLKMQSSWPASLTLQDNFKFFAERVDKLTGGQLKIDALAAGAGRAAVRGARCHSKKVIDGAHAVSYYWVGKNKAATLFSSTPAGPFGMDHDRLSGLALRGRRPRPVVGLLPEGTEAQRHRVSHPAVRPAGVRLVQAPDQEPRRLQGHEVPADGHRRRDLPAHGHADRQHAGRRDRALRAARRDRLRGMGRRRRGSAPRPAAGVEVPLRAGHARDQLDRRADHQLSTSGKAWPRSSRKRCSRRRPKPSCGGG